MSEFERCPVCKGRKTVAGLGMIYKTCAECEGIGHVVKKEPIARYVIKEDNPGMCELVTSEPHNVINDKKAVAPIKKPYGRTKKAKP